MTPATFGGFDIRALSRRRRTIAVVATFATALMVWLGHAHAVSPIADAGSLGRQTGVESGAACPVPRRPEPPKCAMPPNSK